MALHHPSNIDVETITATTFFEEIMPALLDEYAEMAKQNGALYNFDLTGAGGGQWNIDMATRKVGQGLADKAHLLIRMPAADFQQVLGGGKDQPEPNMNKVVISGSIVHLQTFMDFVGRAVE
jgi:hypothetical protein